MKTGNRALGIAESYRGGRSTLAGAVVRADRVLDDLFFTRCSVGGTDATDAIADLVSNIDRPDVQYVLIAGIAPAWYNIVDLHTLAEVGDRPVLSVSFEESSGLEEALRAEFQRTALDERLGTYRRQPRRSSLSVNGETVYLRNVGISDAAARDVVRTFTPEGGRPEPLRVARMAARAGDSWVRRIDEGDGTGDEM